MGRLETSEDFKAKKTIETEALEVGILKIKVRQIEGRDIEERNLPKNTKGLVITEIENDSPINYLKAGNIIIEAQKKKISNIKALEDIVEKVLNSEESTLLIVVFNSQNQRRYLGVKLK